jgi:hypothetical protein
VREVEGWREARLTLPGGYDNFDGASRSTVGVDVRPSTRRRT